MKLLGIDTSGGVASVALCDENMVLAQTSIVTQRTHSQVILPLAKRLLEDAGTSLPEIDGIAVANGPGSYTGLRIGIAAVKAMCFALDKPCAGISTLESLAQNLAGFSGILCPVMTARQELVYTASFCWENGQIKRLTADRILSAQALADELNAEQSVLLNGDGAEKFFAQYGNERILLAPPHLRLQTASSLCFAAFGKEMGSPEALDARYLQPTKAEKDLTAAKK